MAESVPMVAIKSWKNSSEKWFINLTDYNNNPSGYTLWDDDVSATEAEASSLEPEPPESEPVVAPDAEEPPVPSVNDFEQDEDGSEWVNVIDPQNQRRRQRIQASSYDPDTHRLWSTHPRFQR